MFSCQVCRGSLFKTEEGSIMPDYCSLHFYAKRQDGPSQKIFMTVTWPAGCCMQRNSAQRLALKTYKGNWWSAGKPEAQQ